MLRMQTTDQKDGSSRLFAAACRAVEHNLDDTQALSAIHKYTQKRPLPKDWSDDEIITRLRDAEHKVERGVIAREVTDLGKRKIVIDTDEHRVVTETVDALAVDETIYHRGGVLVRVIHEQGESDAIRRGAGAPSITSLPPANLRERMPEEWFRFLE